MCRIAHFKQNQNMFVTFSLTTIILTIIFHMFSNWNKHGEANQKPSWSSVTWHIICLPTLITSIYDCGSRNKPCAWTRNFVITDTWHVYIDTFWISESALPCVFMKVERMCGWKPVNTVLSQTLWSVNSQKLYEGSHVYNKYLKWTQSNLS